MKNFNFYKYAAKNFARKTIYGAAGKENKFQTNKSLEDAGINKDNTLDITKMNNYQTKEKEFDDLDLDSILKGSSSKVFNNVNTNTKNTKENLEILTNPEKREEALKEEMKKFPGFEAFKERNKNLKKPQKEKENMVDEKTFEKLQQLIEEDEENEKYKTIPSNNKQDAKTYEEDQKELLVKRPSKDFVWGLGQQTKQKKCNI